MADDLRIQIVGTLEEKKTIDEINKDIEKIAKNIDKIKISGVLDDKITNTLNKFTESFEKINKSIGESTNVVREWEKETVKADGTIEKVIRKQLQTGEIIEKTKIKIKEQTQTIITEQKELDKLTEKYTKFGKVIQIIQNKDANQQTTSWQRTSRNELTNLETTEHFRAGDETAYKVVNNIEKIEKAELKAQSEISNAIAQTESKRREEIAKSEQAQAKFINKSLDDNYKLQKDLESFKKRMLGDGKLSGEIDLFSSKQKGKFDKNVLTDIRKEIDGLNINTPNLSEKIKNLNSQFSLLKKSAMDSGNILTRTFENAFKFARFFIVGGFIVSLTNMFKNGIRYVMELDNSLNEIMIVTNKTQKEVEALGKSYNNLAKEMSVTTAELAGTAADLFRQGLDEGQVEERMKAIVQYAKISAISVDESNKIITATANATGESVQKITDVFAYLGKQNCPLVA